jgi:hypothetical protein
MVFAMAGIKKCEYLACRQNLSSTDIKPINASAFSEMNRTGLFTDEISCTRSAMVKISKLFDVLNEYTSITSAERTYAGTSLLRNLGDLADRLSYPA